MNYLIFNGESSADYGIYIGGQGTYDAPVRDVTTYSIAGKNGELIHDNGRFKNIELTYPLVIMKDFEKTSSAVNAWLLSPTGYARLEDTYHPDYFRMARVSSKITYQTSAFNLSGKAKIKFNCKPQRFRKDGENIIKFTESEFEIFNPERFESEPFIRIRGTGNIKLTVGNNIINITELNGYIGIDSEAKNCYAGTQNRNDKVSLSKFPTLKSGKNNIKVEGNVEYVEIMGRWWTI